jgi:hypothetical protein
MACVLTATGAETALPESAGAHQHRPALVPLGAGPEVAVVFGLDSIASPGSIMVPLADVTFDPTGPWPPAIPASHTLAISGGASFAPAPRPGATFSLLYDLESIDPPTGGVFAEDVSPQGNAAGTLFEASNGPALFVASNGAHHVAGHEIGVGERLLGIHLFEDATETTSMVGACAGGALAGAAIPFGAGFLVAATTGTPFGECPGAAGALPDVVELLRVSPGGTPWIQLVTTVSTGVALTKVALLPRPGGAWLLTQQAANGPAAPVHVQPLGATGSLIGAAFDVVPEGALAWGAAALGDGFALVWMGPTTQPALGLAVYGAGGTEIVSSAIPLSIGAVEGPPALFVTNGVANDGATVLVAWSQRDESQVATLRFARLACVAGG